MEEEKTVAELTIFYKKQRLTSLIFDKQETADKFLEGITHFFNEKGKKKFSFSGEIKTVYTPESIVGQLHDYTEGNAKPKGTILEMMKIIDGLN
jgi:ABC-type Fe3+-hydroxamate transport system substrate-binding protein